ncbi:MAG: ABC transporter permease subunit [Bifidobacteriaceae bacterium]|jgi:ABC-type nitrate/sulfonate/bicarbonate transport system permease component|nr:ABC transporter permease subunit [Bifidobacteriaceae bacterium]
MNKIARACVWNLALPLALLGVIALATEGGDSIFFPPLSQVFSAFPETWDWARVTHDVVPSLYRLLVGLLIGAGFAVVAGTVLGMAPRLNLLANPVIAYLRALPSPAIIPMFLILFGIGDLTKIATIALGTTWPMLLNTIDGVRSVPAVQLETMRVLGLPRLSRCWLCFRHASPQFFAGARQSISLAIILMVVSEMVMSTNGIGYAVIQFQRQYSITRMWTGIILLGLLGVLAAWAGETLERRCTRWYAGLHRRQELTR